jgi:hypothetical protein
MQQSFPLDRVVHWKKFKESNDLFDTDNAVSWFIRKNQRVLVDAGALIKVRNQWHFVRPEFDQVFLDICKGRGVESVERARIY